MDIKFKKGSDIFFNRADLGEAICLHTDEPKSMYAISIRNSYPCLCIGHRHWYLHRLLGELYFGNLDGYSIHHIDGDKKNNSKENLQLVTNSEHTRLHHLGNDFRSDKGIVNSVNAMANAKRRDDVKAEDVKRARENGATYKELTEMFRCGNSVIRRCLQ